MLKRLIKSTLAKAGLGMISIRGRYYQDGLFTIHSDHFRTDPTFRAAYARGLKASNGIDPGFDWRLHIALWAARTALHVEGDFVECGVNSGFISSAIMTALEWNSVGRRYYLIDTFAGPVLTQYSEQEIQRGRLAIAMRALAAGAYVTDVCRIRRNFAEWPSALVVTGIVPQVLDTLDFGRIAFVHLDMNCAAPEVGAFDFFWKRLTHGGVILLDDYAYYGHNCQRDAIDEAAQAVRAAIVALPTGQGLIIR
jgi:hypothetical protein